MNVTEPALKIVVEEHSDGFSAYVANLACGVIVAQGESLEAALADACSAVEFHRETFGPESLKSIGEISPSRP